MTPSRSPGTPGRVAVSVTVDATTVRRGDTVMVGGQAWTVEDMAALPQGAKRLHFTTGETMTLRSTSVLWATRVVPARRAGRF